jgi:hypothetical protein
MARNHRSTQVALPPDVAEWMGLWDDVAQPVPSVEAEPMPVPAQRSWRNRIHLTSRRRGH